MGIMKAELNVGHVYRIYEDALSNAVRRAEKMKAAELGRFTPSLTTRLRLEF